MYVYLTTQLFKNIITYKGLREFGVEKYAKKSKPRRKY